MNQFSDCVIATGFEPVTVCLEGRCSIQLSYATRMLKGQRGKPCWPLSGWQDSNLRPPAPKAGAITGLRYTPNGYPISNNWKVRAKVINFLAFAITRGETGIRTPGTRLGYACLANKSFRPLRHLSNVQ